MCQSASPATLSATPAGGTWSGTGVSGSTFNPNNATAGANTVTYTVAASGGCAQVTDNITINVNPLPTATISGTVTVCQGDNAPAVTFTGASGTAPYTFTYTLNGGANQTIVSTGNTASIAAPTTVDGTFTYALVSVQDASTTTCSNAQTGTAVVTVKIKPVIALAVSNAVICSGSNVTITPSSTPAGASYTWVATNNSTTGGSSSAGSVIADNLSTTGTTGGTTDYTVTGTLNGCTGTAQTTITVNPVPTATAMNATICSGDMTAINLNSNIPGTTFAWTATPTSGVNGSSNGTGNQIAQTITSMSGGTVTYAVTPTFGNCPGSPINVVVTVNPLPLVVVTPSTASVCQGSSTTLVASGAVSYVWTPANGLSSTTTASVTATPPATVTYTVTGTDANNCKATSQAVVTVKPYPVLAMSPDATICVGETTVLTANGATTYAWTPTTGLNTAVGNSVSAMPSTTTVYHVAGTTNGCTSYDSVLVKVNPLPIVDAGADKFICKGTPVILSGSGALTYTWSNGIVDGSPFIVDTTRTYSVVGVDANGCKNTDYITVSALDAPVISFIADTTSGCAPMTVQFTNNTTGAVKYTWDFGDGQTSTAASPYHDYEQEGCYDVTLIADNGQGCAITITMDDYICVHPSPKAGFVSSTYEITNVMNEVFFSNQSVDATSYEWYFGDETGFSTKTNPKYTYNPEIIRNYMVTLVAKNSFGCTDTARVAIKMTEDVVFYVPNAFTPDGDQFNNVFKPVIATGFDGYDYELLIFDRWGELIFESHDINIGWDGVYKLTGKICQDGAYVWKINIKKKGVDDRITKTGHVTLIR
jgi:gliding motility-associated-like protein